MVENMPLFLILFKPREKLFEKVLIGTILNSTWSFCGLILPWEQTKLSGSRKLFNLSSKTAD